MSLAVVIPVYNEEKSIAILITDLRQMLEGMGIDFKLIIINDGSTDSSRNILLKLAAADKRITLFNEQNKGHGACLLKGYRAALAADMIFQIDSDYQYSLNAFPSLWSERKNFDLLIAQRERKESSLSRDIISFISRWQTKILFGGALDDINCPFRLMSKSMLEQALQEIPPTAFAPNMLISAYCIKNRLPVFTTVCHLNRSVALRKSKLNSRLFSGSANTFADMLRLRFNSKRDEK
ncbi:MAG: glycosyltransferase family 2 protein [Chitinophagaceae bacterium]|nr:MAG: glycosyltransferase family 2 protein [Chitinophagaceae bacterium]